MAIACSLVRNERVRFQPSDVELLSIAPTKLGARLASGDRRSTHSPSLHSHRESGYEALYFYEQ